MDEKTEELREIFIDTTGADTVTESQEEGPGSLATDESEPGSRLTELVETMRERYEFESGLDTEELVTVVRNYFDDADDAGIAAAVGTDEATVFEARMDLHLVREVDRDAPFELAELRRLHVEELGVDEMAERLETDPDTVRDYLPVVEADLESTRANDRFRDGFAELLTDSELEDQMARDTREDGLEEATEDIETDVSF